MTFWSKLWTACKWVIAAVAAAWLGQRLLGMKKKADHARVEQATAEYRAEVAVHEAEETQHRAVAEAAQETAAVREGRADDLEVKVVAAKEKARKLRQKLRGGNDDAD